MRKRDKGQVLLLLVLVIAAVLSIAGAIFFESLTQQQISKIQEESSRALSLAESLAEKAINEGVNVALDQGSEGKETFFGEAKIVTQTANEFFTPLLFKDEQYLVYLANLGNSSEEIQQKLRNIISGSESVSLAENHNLSLQVDNKNDFGGEVCPTDYVFEIGLLNLLNLNLSSNPIKYKIIDCSGIVESDTGDEISMGSSFNTEGSHLMFIRVLKKGADNTGVRLKITSDKSFPIQGKTVESTVRSVSGVTETITLFQSYPQLPASLFITSAGSPQD